MVKKCCVRGCRSESYAGCNISFHSFPNNERLRAEWLKAVGGGITCKNPFVYSLHFEKNDYKPTTLPVLKNDAIPHKCLMAPLKRIAILGNIPISPTPSTSFEVHKSEEPLAKLPRLEHSNTSTQTSTLISPKEEELKKRVKLLQQKLKRRDSKIESLSILLGILKKKCKNYDEVKVVMENNFQNIHKHFNVKNSSTGVRYSDELKQFALTLYFYSGPAYNLLRNHVTLPHPATLRKILATTDCNVGFIKEALEFLQGVSSKDDNIKDVALLFDAMTIKAEEVFDRHKGKFVGYIDFGGILQPDVNVLATEALVFQIVSLKKRFKCPVAYFLTNKMTAHVQAQLLITAIRMLSEVNINVRSLTCDGTQTNKSTYEILGCDFSDPDNYTTCFKHPTTSGNRIHCIFDPPHMIKLARNVFAETKMTSRSGPIHFSYVKELHLLQEEEGLRLANKLCNAHINFFQKKMNVKLAVQVLSSSVADAIDFLNKSGHPKFAGSEPTVEYIRMIDRAFDLMNAKDPRGSGFQSPLKLENKNVWTTVFKETRDYLCSLKVNGEHILSHRRKVPALGLIVNTFSIQNSALDFLERDENKYFLPYKCSQDHLEMFFSCIRARGGSNDNPNALQLRYTMRKLLFHNSVKPSIHANCTDDSFELSPIVEFRSQRRSLTGKEEEKPTATEEKQMEVLFDHLENIVVSEFKLNILYYITGAIVSKLIKTIYCEHCHAALLTSKKENDHSYSVDLHNFSAFTTFVDRGGLKYVSKFPFEVIIFAEKLFNLTMSTEPSNMVTRNKLMTLTTQYCISNLHTFQLQHPLQSINSEDDHGIQLIKAMARMFFNLRMAHRSKTNSLRTLGNKIGLRQKLHKTILFSNL